MPHFVIHCSERLEEQLLMLEVMQGLQQIALESELFEPENIKVRLQSFEHHIRNGQPDNFIHIFAYIMEGRTDEQKKDLSNKMVALLNRHFPACSVLSMNVMEFEKASYCNKYML